MSIHGVFSIKVWFLLGTVVRRGRIFSGDYLVVVGRYGYLFSYFILLGGSLFSCFVGVDE